MKNRIYVVWVAGQTRLIRASSRSAALRYAVRESTVQVASQDELVRMLADGVKVDDAGDGHE